MSDPIVRPEDRLAVSVSGRIKALDGFRGVAVLSIVFLHFAVHHLQVQPGTLPAYARQYLMFLRIGVDAFFVLSGFLIGGILLEQQRAPRYFQVFYLRRALRIIPPYLLLIAGWWLASGWGNQPGMRWLLDPDFPLWPYVLYLQNLWMAAYKSVGPLFVAATWSLAIEEQFYLIFPILVRFAAPQAFLRVLLWGIFSAPLFRVGFAMLDPNWQTAQDFLLPTRWDSLLLGALVAWIVRHPETLSWIAARRKQAWRLLVLAGAIVALIPFLPKNPAPAIVYAKTAGIHLLVAIFFSMILLFLHLNWLPGAASLLANRVLCFFGRISYSLYLLHVAILGLMFAVVLGKEPVLASWVDFGVMIAAFVCTVGLAHFTWRLFEQRLIGFGHKFSYQGTAATGLGK